MRRLDSRNPGVVRLAEAAILALLVIGGLGAGIVRGQGQTFQNSFATTVAVVPGGTLVFTVSGAGVTISGTSQISGCPTSGIGSQRVAYACDAGSDGIPAGTVIQQIYAGSRGPVAETATYNANGPQDNNPLLFEGATKSDGRCAPPAALPIRPPAALPTTPPSTQPSTTVAVSCSVRVGATSDMLLIAALSEIGQTIAIQNAPQAVGACPLQGGLPASNAHPGHPVGIVYACGSGESIPANTNVMITVLPGGPLADPSNLLVTSLAGSGFSNDPGDWLTSDVPAPQTVTMSSAAGTAPISVDGTATAGSPSPSPTSPPGSNPVTPPSAAPALTSLSPLSGAPGSTVTLFGSGLNGATAATFGSAFSGAGCSADGTSCQALVPQLAAGPVNVTLTLPGGTTNPLSFTVLGAANPSPLPSAGSQPATPGSGGIAVPTSPGWNLVGGPSGASINGSSGSLFTYQGSDVAYESFGGNTTLQGGLGYWAFFGSPGSLSLPPIGSASQSVTLPASHWVMIGNPGTTPATVTGADIIYSYNPAITNGVPYTQVTTLQPGQGAWAISINGGVATIVGR